VEQLVSDERDDSPPSDDSSGRAKTAVPRSRVPTALVWGYAMMPLLFALVVWPRAADESVRVPELVGEQVTDAQAKLFDVGLRASVEGEIGPDLAGARVIDQYPGSGDETVFGGTVVLRVEADASSPDPRAEIAGIQAFPVAGAGSVSIARHIDQLLVTDVELAKGWDHDIEVMEPAAVTVRFTDGARTMSFRAELHGDELQVRILEPDP
jgi:hypothetical protein